MHAIHLAGAATGRDKILKFEGGYHGADFDRATLKPHENNEPELSSLWRGLHPDMGGQAIRN
jgi:glutamate-1-semialdehyde aminotransferase